MAQELRIGVIGAGGRGALAGHAHKPDEGVRIVAGADTDLAALKRFSDHYGPSVLATADYREVLSDPTIGAVFVTTPGFPARRTRRRRPRGGQGRVPREAYGDHRRGVRPDPADRRPAGAQALRRPQHATHEFRPEDEGTAGLGPHRGGEGGLVPPLRGLRRRRLLQGLARRPHEKHEPAVAERCARYRRPALPVRRPFASRERDGGAEPLQPHHRPPRARRARKRGVLRRELAPRFPRSR